MTPPDPPSPGRESPSPGTTSAIPVLPEDRRSICYVVRISPNERKALGDQAKSMSLKLADYVRSRIFGYRLPKRQLAVDEQTYRTLSELSIAVRNIGGNLNQISHSLHLGFPADVNEIQQLVSKLKPLLDDLRKSIVEKAPDPETPDTTESEWEDGDR